MNGLLKEEISNIINTGQCYNFSFFKVYKLPDKEQQAKLAVIVPKRHVNKAVARNYIKRVVRESFRFYKEEFDIVVLITNSEIITKLKLFNIFKEKFQLVYAN